MIASLVVAALLFGCEVFVALGGGEGLPCDNDQSCPPGLLCIDQRCARQCQTNDDCADGICVNNVCIAIPDASPLDTALADAASSDAAHVDAVLADGVGVDTAQGDAALSDAVLVDTHLSDTCMADTRIADTRIADTRIPDTRVPDTRLSDTRVPDTRLSDTRLPDTWASDTAPVCNGVWCDNVCYTGGRCCEASDCDHPSAICNAGHMCQVEITLQQGLDGYSDCQATYINRDHPDNSYADPIEIWVRSDDWHAGLIRFDLSSIPPSSQIIVADLSLHDISSSTTGWLVVDLFRVLRSWSSFNASWNQASDGVSWSTAGCNGIGSDRSGTVTAFAHLDSVPQWYSFDVTADAQFWLSSPGSNHGLAIKSSSWEWSVAHHLVSPTNAATGLRPRLRIVYVEP